MSLWVCANVRLACLSRETRDVGVIPSILFAAPYTQKSDEVRLFENSKQ
jgi:hypothetical protein